MPKISDPIIGRNNEALRWLSGTIGFIRIPGLILFLVLLHHPIQAFSQTSPGDSVTLTWERSPDSSVAGYRVYYGAVSGIYTNNLVVGNVTTITISGLASGVTYFFAISAYDANGLESALSNEIFYTVPGALPTVRIRVTAARQVILTVAGQVGQTYDLQTSSNLTSWTVLGAVTLGAGGSVDFTDTNAASFPKRFYRTQQKP